MSKAKTWLKRIESESEEAFDASDDSRGEDHLIVGGGDEMGGYDDSQFQQDDENKKKKKNNIVRKSSTLFTFRPSFLTAHYAQMPYSGSGTSRRFRP